VCEPSTFSRGAEFESGDQLNGFEEKTRETRAETLVKNIMKPKRHLTFLTTTYLTIAWLALGCLGGSNPASAQDKKDAAKGGAIFKVPDGYMQMPFSDFRGMLMLDPKKPAGMFVTHPNDNETTESLRLRLLKTIGPMFIHSEKGKPETPITWTILSLPSHPGDGDGKAVVNTYSDETQELQVAIYERIAGQSPFVYGYFAMRLKKAKGDDGKFLDEHGEGIKAFDKLWNSFPK
jgi:hypothetical protein